MFCVGTGAFSYQVICPYFNFIIPFFLQPPRLAVGSTNQNKNKNDLRFDPEDICRRSSWNLPEQHEDHQTQRAEQFPPPAAVPHSTLLHPLTGRKYTSFRLISSSFSLVSYSNTRHHLSHSGLFPPNNSYHLFQSICYRKPFNVDVDRELE